MISIVTIRGRGVSGGIAFGSLEVVGNSTPVIKRKHTDDTETELRRFDDARFRASEQLYELYQKACQQVGEENAMIFDIHRMMLEDDDFLGSVRSHIITQKINAESAVAIASDAFADMFSHMEDSYMQARAADVRDISERIIALLTGIQKKRHYLRGAGGYSCE